MGLHAVASNERTSVARPLRVLVPLIKEELQAGDQAGLTHYRRAGEMLIEAKEQVDHGEWGGWLKRNFHLSGATAYRYMKLVEIPAKIITRENFVSQREALKHVGADPGGKGTRWYEPVKSVVARVNLEALAKDRQDREREQQMLQLGHQLIDIGYKVLSSKLHPDKGGSTEAMARLSGESKAPALRLPTNRV
jgi:hypothetical protein